MKLLILLTLFMIGSISYPSFQPASAYDPSGHNPSPKATISHEKPPVSQHSRDDSANETDVNVDDLYRKWREVMAGRSQAILLDVRLDEHRSKCWIEGTRHVSSERMRQIPAGLPSKDAEIWVFCRTDPRAERVAGFLRALGYSKVFLVGQAPDGTPGGVTGWEIRGYPLKGPGCPGEVR
jgi:rhodanese-related sulfurtransferase